MKIHTLKRDYIRSLLLSEFDLSESYINEHFINGLLKKPIDEITLNINSERVLVNLFISFSYISVNTEMTKKSKNKMYRDLHCAIQNKIKNEWVSIGYKFEDVNDKILYKLAEIKNNDKTKKDYIYFYLSPIKALHNLDYEKQIKRGYGTKNSDAIISVFLNVYLRNALMDDISHNSVNDVIFTGELGLHAIEDRKGRVSTYICNLFFSENRLRFNLKKQLYKNKSKESNLLYDFFFINNNTKKTFVKDDARNCKRPFLDLSHYASTNDSKFICQIRTYKAISKMLTDIKIKHKDVCFTPTKMIEGFKNKNSKLDRVYLYNTIDINERDYDRIVNSFESANIKVVKAKSCDINDVLNNFSENNIFLVNSDDSNYVFDKHKKEYTYKNAVELFLDKLSPLNNYDNFIEAIKQFDIYTQVKLYNLFANCNPTLNLKNIVSQGLDFTNCNLELSDDLIVNKDLLTKISNELNIKNDLYVGKGVNIKTFTDMKPFIDIKSIKVIKEFKFKKNLSLYSLVELQNVNNDKFSISRAEIINTESIGNEAVKDFKEHHHDTQIIINDKFLITLDKGKYKPTIVMDKTIYKDKELDPFNHVIKRMSGIKTEKNVSISKKTGKPSDGVSRTANPKNMMFWPYTYPKNASLVDSKLDKNSFNKSLFSINGNNLTHFLNIESTAAKNIIHNDTLLRYLELFRKGEIDLLEINWEDYEQFIYLIFDTFYIDYLNINRGTKTTYFEKLANTILSN